MAIIELLNINKEYRSDDISTLALSDINLRIAKGEFVAIMGTSGSGKTTLLNIIGCMDSPSFGTYLFAGNDVGGLRENELSKYRGKRISFVFQHFALIDDYSVLENVKIPLLKHQLSDRKNNEKAMAALKMIGIEKLAFKRPDHLSGGQKQRVAIARAIACGAEVILADETTGALDSRTSREIMKIFRELNEKGITIVVITHDKEIAAYAKRLINIQDGRIIKDEKI